MNSDETFYRAIIFDVGGTLLKTAKSIPTLYYEVLRSLGVSVTHEMVREAMQKAELWAYKERQSFPYLFNELDFIKYQNIFYGVLGIKGRRLINRLERDFAFKISEKMKYELYDSVKPTLRALQDENRVLIAADNWDKSLHDLLRKLKIHSYFDVVVSSQEAGVTKPSREFYDYVFSKAKIKDIRAKRVLYIADYTPFDFEGHTELGFKQIIYVPPKNWMEWELPKPFKGITVKRLSELPNIIEKLEKQMLKRRFAR